MDENQFETPDNGAGNECAGPEETAAAPTAGEPPLAEGGDPAMADSPAAEPPAGESSPAADAAAPAPAETETPAAADPDDVPESDSAEAPEDEALLAEQLLGDQQQPAAQSESEAAELKAVLEAIVYVLNEPMPARQIAEALGRDVKEVEPVLRQLAEETSRADRGLFIREVAGGYQMATKPEHHEVIATFVKNLKQPLKLSQAALETLAVIAYRQPITMPEILEIRGVQGGGVVKTLIDRKLITTAGRKNVIGKPMLYKTTKDFLTQFGLRDLAELPSLKEFEEIRRQSIADDEVAASPQQTLDLPQAEAAAELPPAPAPESLPESQPETQPETAPAPEPAPEAPADHE